MEDIMTYMSLQEFAELGLAMSDVKTTVVRARAAYRRAPKKIHECEFL
jgi:hypothetical protein